MLSYEQATELFEYCPETGVLRWKVARYRKIKAGDIAGCQANYGNGKSNYIVVRPFGIRCYAHRIAWLIYFGSWPVGQIDHIDHDGTNNRIENLRDVCFADNRLNMPMFDSNTSGFTGVSWDKSRSKWESYINHEGKRKHLGRFDNIEDAATARKKAEQEYGYHDNHGRNV